MTHASSAVVVRLRDDAATGESLRALFSGARPPALPLDAACTEHPAGWKPLFQPAAAVVRRRPWIVLPDDRVPGPRYLSTTNLLRLSSANEAEAIARLLATDPRVRDAYVVPGTAPAWTSGEPEQDEQWGLGACGFPAAWATSPASTAPVAVVDSGLDRTHVDAPKVTRWTTFDLGDADAMGHGTGVAGVIAAPRNGRGIAGAAPAPVEIYKVFRGATFDRICYYDALHLIATSDCRVVNMSFGSPKPDVIEAELVQACISRGKILVAPMGNSSEFGNGSVLYPAALPFVVAVGAIDSDRRRAWYSIAGDHLWIMAPGTNIRTTVPGGYGWMTGTSLAAPFVSAACALLAARTPGLDADGARTLLRRYSAPAPGGGGWSPEYGVGRLDLSSL